MHRLPSGSFWIWMPPTISCTGNKKGAFITAITTVTAICRCTCFAASICCARACGCPISTLRPVRGRSWRLWGRMRQRWPAVEILLRGDGGFCREKLMAWWEREGIKSIFGLAQNARLKKLIEEQMAQAEKQYEQTKAPARVFTEFLYATQDTWSRQRRVIAKAEHIAKGANPRFVVTSLSPQQMAAQELYEKVYCARGECPENRIKEQQLDLFADRTSTGKMWSNQLRLYFSSITYVLLQTLRRTALAGTELEKAQCGTI